MIAKSNRGRMVSLIVFLLTLTVAVTACRPAEVPTAEPARFDGVRAWGDVETQVNFGPRIPGETGHASFLLWAQETFEGSGWEVTHHQTERSGRPVVNFIAKRDSGEPSKPWVILAAHYDTRPLADRDPDPAIRSRPVPGANDGASGVAVLSELARVLPPLDEVDVWLVLFDQEDGGDLFGQEWILGSQAFVDELPQLAPGRTPDRVVVVDMVGDPDLNIHIEQNSDPVLTEEIWAAASALGYGDVIIADEKYNMIDDHRPFLRVGIPAVLMIDFDYVFWHTVADTPENVSAESLEAVGSTLYTWLVDGPGGLR